LAEIGLSGKDEPRSADVLSMINSVSSPHTSQSETNPQPAPSKAQPAATTHSLPQDQVSLKSSRGDVDQGGDSR
jgi:hypothetical protein